MQVLHVAAPARLSVDSGQTSTKRMGEQLFLCTMRKEHGDGDPSLHRMSPCEEGLHPVALWSNSPKLQPSCWAASSVIEDWFLCHNHRGEQGYTLYLHSCAMAHLEGEKYQSFHHDKKLGASGAHKNKG